jgi:TonB-linked SusC/RagA family outer membrane protein
MNLLASSSYSQNTKITLNMKDTSIESVLNKIENESEFYFLYNHELIDVTRKVNIAVQKKPIKELLNEIFEDDVEIIVSDRQIVLKPVMEFVQNEEVNSQQQSINGKVTDASSGEPLPGVNVVIEGTQTGAITDADGNFVLQRPERGAIISFSFIGYITQSLTYSGENVINMNLPPSLSALDEVVVIGYGTQRKSNVTGSISQVKVDEFINRTVTGADQALQGKTSGVLVINSSHSPGATPTVRIRGFSSNASSDPLYVVDGLRVSASDVGRIDPNTIESMEVLKDAASAAIYGAQAGNGVVLITTRSGSGMGKISYDLQYTLQNLSNMPKVLNSEQYINFYSEAGQITQDMLNLYWDGNTSTNWAEVAFDQSIMQRHTIQFEGANDKGSLFASASYTDNDGIVVGDKDTYKRYAISINADYKLKPWIKFTSNNALGSISRNSLAEGGYSTSVFGGVLVMDPLTPVYRDENNLSDLMITMIDGGWSLLKNSDGLYYSLSDFNGSPSIHPFVRRDATDNTARSFQLRGIFSVDLTPIKALTFTSRLGYLFGDAFSNIYTHDFFYNDQAYAGSNSISSTTSLATYYQWENFANYLLDIKEHHFSAMVGMSYSDRYDASTYGWANQIEKDDPSYQWLAFATGSSTKDVDGIELNTRELSYFGRVGYNFKEKYILQASFRADAGDLSKLSPNARWGYFPSISAGWILSNEGFLEGLKSKGLSLFKLRASWGQNGSISGLRNYMWKSSIAAGTRYPLYSTTAIDYVNGASPSVLGNEDLTWETSQQINVGFDSRFFNDKLSFSFDWFNKKTIDLIITNAIPSLEVGNASSPINGGDVENSGLEFELGWRDEIGDFNYSLNANLATIKNEVTFLTESVSGRILGADVGSMVGLTAFEAGYPVWYFRGYKVIDVDDVTGNAVFEDVNKDGTISSDDMTYIGSAIPDFTYGLTLNLEYKGFDFSVFATGSQGNQIYNQMTRVDCPLGNKLATLYDDRWTESNTDASRPKPMSNNYDKYTFSNALVFDASYLKIKQIQIGYTIPSTLLSKIGISNCRAYVSLDDYFTFTQYPGLDPETANATSLVSYNGVDRGNYPSSKKFLGGFRITF